MNNEYLLAHVSITRPRLADVHGLFAAAPAVFFLPSQALKPDGAFIGAMLGGSTLTELRSCLLLAEQEREVSVRWLPRKTTMPSTLAGAVRKTAVRRSSTTVCRVEWGTGVQKQASPRSRVFQQPRSRRAPPAAAPPKRKRVST